MNFYVNSDIKNTIRVFPNQGRYSYQRYDMNENPEGLPKAFVDTVLREITPEFLATYPESDRFTNKYANYIGASYENILCTNGSDMAIRYLLETFGEKGKEVVTVSPSFEMYSVNCSILGLKHVPVSYNHDLTINVYDIIQAINKNTRIIVLLNPNNPIGDIYTEDELKEIIYHAKSVGAIVIIDEAYHYFYSSTFLNYAIAENNVVVLRTFSKLFSIAACRLGVIISNPDIIQYVKNIRLTFDVNSIALLFGERLLERPDIIENLISAEIEGKAYLLQNLINNNYLCKECKGNFILVKTKRNPKIVANELKENKKILVHAYNNEILKPYIRISTGSKTAMEAFLMAFYDVDK